MTLNLIDELLSKFINSQHDLESLVDEISEIIKQVQAVDFTKLPNDKKIEADLLVLYAINSLYFINLRIKHVDSDFVKVELKRIQETMKKFKQTKDKLTIMPRLDKDASKRFVRNALWTPPESDTPCDKKTKDIPPVSKKTKFDADGNVIEETITIL
ncbi:nuclear nucleic acid-binding protein C1D-like [Diaphorina citri]|jgi:Sas10/Utp3/C1D family.|uniref:Nuclear nucleic acid-binding protein C1D n=1 Tax=Diaphorina citri TaxID=121845 RepID=A0A1S3D4G4_DIACI|nr:nuclear nucleic acid-binding protein C1D-like [Diaphorina citri]KAI5702269.1 hypothetical protein M8J76_014418 [Diaphorina citri]KAI5739212.1 hypothetical protein M8J77_016402 [Diaphorina citri]